MDFDEEKWKKQESAYYLQITACFGKYFFSLLVYLGRYMRSSSVTYLVRFLSTPDINMKQFHCVPLSVCSLTPSFTQVVLNRTMSVTIWAAPSSCTTMSLGSSACLCSNTLINNSSSVPRFSIWRMWLYSNWHTALPRPTCGYRLTDQYFVVWVRCI